MQFGVAVIYYNPKKTVLEQLAIYDKVFEKILIVDNSNRKSEELISEVKKYGTVTYFDMQGNKGMSCALNRAFTWANEQSLDYILTMDQDSRYSFDNIKTMLQYIETNKNENVVIYVANFSKLYQDKKSNTFISGKPVLDKNETKEVAMCLTSGSYINVQAVQKILPLQNYFIGYVDNFISTDLIKSGYKLVRVGASCFDQQVGEPVRYTWLNQKLRILHHKEIRYYYMIRNNCYYRQKYKTDKRIVRISYKLLLRLLFNIIVGEPGKISKIKACLSGYTDFRKGIYGEIPAESIVW